MGQRNGHNAYCTIINGQLSVFNYFRFFKEDILFLFQIKLFCNHPVHQKMVENKLEIHKDKTLTEATQLAHKVWYILDVFAPILCFFCEIARISILTYSASLMKDNTGEKHRCRWRGHVTAPITFQFVCFTLKMFHHDSLSVKSCIPGFISVKCRR